MKTRDKLSPSALKLQNPARWICSLATVALLSLGSAYRGQAQSPIVVQTIAALRSLSTSGFTNDTVAYVIDYYGTSSYGYRGGGHFRWRTPYSSISLCCGNVAVDDGGRFIACTSNTNGLWERILDGGTANVKMWGAYGDGSHNDTAALQNALNGAGSWGTGIGIGVGELLFPSGVYMITNTLVFNPTLLHIRGDGPLNTTIKMQLGVSADIFRTYGANQWLTTGSGGYDQGMLFEDLRLYFADDGSTNGHPARNKTNAGLVVALTGEVSTIRNVEVINGGIGIRCLGGGAPGLNLRDVNCSEAAIAGVSIEPLPGVSVDVGGPITIIGLSGDQNFGDVAATASLVLISNVNSLISISSIKAESDFGGGLIHYFCGNNGQDMGHLSLRECNYNAGSTIDNVWYPPDFLKIEPSATFRNGSGPVITIEQANLYAVTNLINDKISGRIVDADVQIPNGGNGSQQLTAKLPITYQASITGAGYPTNQSPGSSLLIGETAISTFYATNAGWYRIMTPYGIGRGDLAGRVSITSPFARESIELQVDSTQYATPWINVTRCKTGVAVVSQARAISYWDNTLGGPTAFVDVYVSNAIPASAGKAARLTVALDTEGVQQIGTGNVQLLSPIIPVSATPPTGASVTTVNTYR